MTQPSVALPRIPFKPSNQQSSLNYSWGQPLLPQTTWGSALVYQSSPTASTSQLPQQQPVPINRRRRRDSSDDEESAEASLKRFRLDSPRASSRLTNTHTKSVEQISQEMSQLSHSALLKVMQSLLTTSPHLAPTISALLPVPSLQEAIETLQRTERAILQAIPTNSRPDYIYNRIKPHIDNYVSNARSLIAVFAPKAAQDPSATVSFLTTLTSSIRLLELELPRPSPLDSALLPMTINAWHTTISKLATQVNERGRIVPVRTLEQWFAQLDQLCQQVVLPAPDDSDESPQEGPARKSIEGVRDRLRREIGWLAGQDP